MSPRRDAVLRPSHRSMLPCMAAVLRAPGVKPLVVASMACPADRSSRIDASFMTVSLSMLVRWSFASIRTVVLCSGASHAAYTSIWWTAPDLPSILALCVTAYRPARAGRTDLSQGRRPFPPSTWPYPHAAAVKRIAARPAARGACATRVRRRLRLRHGQGASPPACAPNGLCPPSPPPPAIPALGGAPPRAPGRLPGAHFRLLDIGRRQRLF